MSKLFLCYGAWFGVKSPLSYSPRRVAAPSQARPLCHRSNSWEIARWDKEEAMVQRLALSPREHQRRRIAP
jgi:hypothetical protein